MLVRKKLTADEFSNSNLRYSDGCDCVQFSPDGGTTWIDQPANDPRTSDAYRLPALTGSNKRCRAAKGMENLIRSFVDTRTSDISEYEMLGVLLGFLAFIPGFNIFYALLIAFVALAFTIAREVLEEAFTEPVYEQIRCVFFCNIDDDGQMDADGFAHAYSEMSVLGTIAQVWVEEIMNLVGYVGLSDAGVALEEAADCDECECDWCVIFDFTTADGNWLAFEPVSCNLINVPTTWGAGTGWGGANCKGTFGQYRHASIKNTFVSTQTLTKVRVTYNLTAGSHPSLQNLQLYDDLTGALYTVENWTSGSDLIFEWTGSSNFTSVALRMIAGYDTTAPIVDPGGSATITSIQIEGAGYPPETWGTIYGTFC